MMERKPGPNGDCESLRLYLREIEEHKKLSAEEELRLARRIKAGDDLARERMIHANLRLVVHLARHFQGLGLPLSDLIGEGNIGLMKAVERFDPGRGTRLCTYAGYYIKLAMRLALSHQSRIIRLPVNVELTLFALRRIQRVLRYRLEREPSEEEVARQLRLPVAKVRRYLRAAMPSVSLEARTSQYNGGSLADMLPDENVAHPGDAIVEDHLFDAVRETLLTLLPRERHVLRERFGLTNGGPKSLDQIGGGLKMSKEGIRRVQNRGLKKLRWRLIAKYGLRGGRKIV
jgi:RNA polymerase primary sigma factor